MYCPCSLRLARRAGDSFTVRRGRAAPPDPRPAASIAGPSRPSARAIDASDLRMDWNSLRTDARPDLGTFASIVNKWSHRTTPVALRRWTLIGSFVTGALE